MADQGPAKVSMAELMASRAHGLVELIAGQAQGLAKLKTSQARGLVDLFPNSAMLIALINMLPHDL